MTATFCSNIDVGSLVYKAPTSNKNGGKVVNVFTNETSTEWKDRLRFQMCEDEKTNLQHAVWNLNVPVQGQDAQRRSFELSIESPQLEKFLTSLDERNVEVATQSSPDWFKKELDKESIRQMYVNLVRPPAKPDMKSSIKVKVKCGDNPTRVFLATEEQDGEFSYSSGSHDDLLRNSKCMVIVETVGLWFMSRQFGMSLVATDILVWPCKRKTGIESFSMSSPKRFVQKSPQKSEDSEIKVDEDIIY